MPTTTNREDAALPCLSCTCGDRTDHAPGCEAACDNCHVALTPCPYLAGSYFGCTSVECAS